ncbi:hypothetical protein GGR52DRAFT_448739 [Hypoxylon sp. FL1284]|nr:hypothetical protein GGR52DRAFT_448739 [Hypoxylon sp. FL1284]
MPRLTHTSISCCHDECDNRVDYYRRACAACLEAYYCTEECREAARPVHQMRCRFRNYTIGFHLAPRLIMPPVYRVLSCPAQATLNDVRKAAQIAFDYTEPAMHHFALLSIARADHKRLSRKPEMEFNGRQIFMDWQPKLLDPTYSFLCPDSRGPVVEELASSVIDMLRAHDKPFLRGNASLVGRMRRLRDKSTAGVPPAFTLSRIRGFLDPSWKLHDLFDNDHCQGGQRLRPCRARPAHALCALEEQSSRLLTRPPPTLGLEMVYIYDQGSGWDWYEHRMTVFAHSNGIGGWECIGGDRNSLWDMEKVNIDLQNRDWGLDRLPTLPTWDGRNYPFLF